MEEQKIDTLMKKAKKAVARVKIYDSETNIRKFAKFTNNYYKVRSKLEKKLGNDASYRLACICLELARENPKNSQNYTIAACNLLEYAYAFNDCDSRAVELLKARFGLLEAPDIHGKMYYFYLSPPQMPAVSKEEPFEFQGKWYLRTHSMCEKDHATTHYVTCTQAPNGEMTYQLVTDWAERDALLKAERSY